jgi:hypothetical protein
LRSVFVFVVCAVALSEAACAGGGKRQFEGTNPQGWTRSYCTALRGWQNENLARGTDLERRVKNSTSAAEARSEIIDYYADAVARIDLFLADLKAIGSPAVRNGASEVRDLRREVLRFRAALVRARVRARHLPSDPAQFVNVNRSIALSVVRASQRMNENLDGLEQTYDTPEIDKAYRNESECKRLRAMR